MRMMDEAIQRQRLSRTKTQTMSGAGCSANVGSGSGCVEVSESGLVCLWSGTS